MTGPRLLSRAPALALAGLILLPACSPRAPIPSDPPEVRTEAQVRGGRKGPPPPPAERAPETRPVTHDPTDVVVAQVKDEHSAAAAQAPKAEAAPAEASKAAGEQGKALAAKPTQAEPAPAAPAKAEAQPKQAAAQKPTEAEKKAGEQKPAEAAAPAPKPEPSPEAKADAASQAAQADPAAVPKTPVVQIASFTTEKNAEAALAWLKQKGYAEARVVRVEQGQATFHRVQAGPFQDPAAARKALEELKPDWPQAFIPAD